MGLNGRKVSRHSQRQKRIEDERLLICIFKWSVVRKSVTIQGFDQYRTSKSDLKFSVTEFFRCFNIYAYNTLPHI